jgi:ferredoxin
MKNLVYWFSGTGNTLSVAKDLAARLGGAEIREIRDGESAKADGDATAIGILYPVYCWGPPNIVAEFARRLEVPAGAYVYAVAVYGAMLANSNALLKNMLAENGVRLAASFGVNLPGNFVALYEISPEAKLARMYAKADAATARIANAVSRGRKTGIARNLGLFGRYLSGSKYGPMIAHINNAAKGFTAEDTCNGCGICARVCPKGNVNVKSGKPEWDAKCESCLACMHWCPSASIQSGEKTKIHKRYHHPAVVVSELFRR